MKTKLPMSRRKKRRRHGISPDAAQARVEGIVHGMLETDALEACARYLSRGRTMATLPDGEVMARWAQSFRDMVAARTRDRLRALDDAGAELRLRGLEPDVNLVKDQMSAVMAEIRRSAMEHPEGDPAILDAIEEYMRRSSDKQMN